MIIAKIRKFLRPVRRLFTRNYDKHLKRLNGVIHVGANTGQERDYYKSHGLKVIWVEPIPHIFSELQENLKTVTGQRAFQALLTDVDNQDYEFHIASNHGASSSIMDLKRHKEIWPV